MRHMEKNTKVEKMRTTRDTRKKLISCYISKEYNNSESSDFEKIEVVL